MCVAAVDSRETVVENAPGHFSRDDTAEETIMVRVSRVLVVSALSLMLAGSFVLRSRAQAGQPIYPEYEGYVKNEDGTLTLSFGYFSHNSDPVTILTGPDNSWSTAPADRNQPTIFLPGHHRFTCSMVVDGDWDGRLRWTLTYGGTTTATTEFPLDILWALEANSARRASRDIDTAAVPTGVCINRPPSVNMGGGRRGFGRRGFGAAARTVALADELALNGNVQDDDLPRDATVVTTWRQVRGPGNVTFANANQASTRASFSAAGTYELELSASDSELDASARVKVTVEP